MSKLRQIFCVLLVAVAWSSDNNEVCYVLPFCFFPRLPIISQEKVMQIGHILNVNHQGAEPGKSLMSTIALFKVHLIQTFDKKLKKLICHFMYRITDSVSNTNV